MNEIVNITVPEVGLTQIDDEPRVRDIELGERLGMKRARSIRELIERNKTEIEGFGTCRAVRHVVRGNSVEEFWLNEEQALLVSILSKAPNATAVRSMLIRVFVAYRRGHLVESIPASLPADLTEYIRRTDGISRMLSGKVTGMEASISALSSAMALIASIVQPAAPVFIRHGQTAGQVWKDHGFPPIRITCWFSNRLAKMGCQMEGGARADFGMKTAKLFDPDKAEVWLRNGGKALVQEYVAQRMGQGKLHLVAGRA